jgi:HD-GYP domain-containing protein (c-di-GMP phosphodiesterase class II)
MVPSVARPCSGTVGALALGVTAPENCLIYYGPNTRPATLRGERWRPADELFAMTTYGEPAVLVVDASMLARRDILRRLPRRVVFVAADDEVQAALESRVKISIAGVNDDVARNRVLDAACVLSCARLAGVRIRRRLASRKLEFRELSRIGMALMLEHDRDALLRQIVDQGKRLTGSDGGGMMLAETDSTGRTYLRAVLARFDYLSEIEVGQPTIPIDDSGIISHAARVREPVAVADAYNLPADATLVADTRFERDFGYYRKSILAVPMLDRVGGLVGVLAFVNRKSDPTARIRTKEDADRYVLPYTAREVSLARSLASQAAVSIENARLHAQIEQILESVVKASVTAIDERDPSTAGHSLRVSALTMGIADAVERGGRGAYRSTRFTGKQLRELRFAALLHDFGKVTVNEDVLMKAKKLPPVLWERVHTRFALIRTTMERDYYKELARLRRSRDDERALSARLEQEFTAQVYQLEQMWAVVEAANEPAILPQQSLGELSDIASRTFTRRGDGVTPYLTPEELRFLQIPRGTLDAAERAEVESHAEQTYRFLNTIPWTDDLGNLSNFALSHHEKLDGSGYPQGLKGDEIPVQVRMITIADIFDALTERNRPYKAAVPPEKALDIIRDEATAGRLDHDLVEIMIESEAYRRILEEDWRRL